MPVELADFQAPTPTEDRKVGSFMEPGNGVSHKDGVEIPALDTAALSREYGMENAVKPQLREGTFRVPLGCTEHQFQQYARTALKSFVVAMDKKGWDWKPTLGRRVSPGIYPARDFHNSDIRLFDQREFVWQAWFQFRNPKPVRIEVPPELLAPVVLGSPRSPRP